MEGIAKYWLSIVSIIAAAIVLWPVARRLASGAEVGEGGSALGNSIAAFAGLAFAVAAAGDVISGGRLGAALLDLAIRVASGG